MHQSEFNAAADLETTQMSGEQNVSVSRAVSDPLEFDVYKRSQANIHRLNEKLPENLVIDLAREVILRVASKDSTLEHVSHEATQEELETLCKALISDDDKAAANIVIGLRASGANAEEIYIKQLAAAARMLGDLWDQDRVNFSQVTVGTGRMFAIMRSMRHLFEPKIPAQDKTAIFASVPGEDHTLGVRMAADIFRKEGWEISLKVGLDHDQLVAEIEQLPTGIVGLSIGGGHSVEALSRLVVALHISCPQAIMMVSGQNIEEARPILSLMGLDGIAGTLEEAKEQLNTLWDQNMGAGA